MHKKRETNYSLLNTLKYAMTNLWKMNKEIFFCCIIQIPCNFIIPFITVLLTSSVVKLVSNGVVYTILILNIIGYSFLLIVLSIILNICRAKVVNSCGSKIRLKYTLLVDMKSINMDYENIENPKGQESHRKAKIATEDIMSGTQRIVMNFVSIISGLINIIIYGIVIGRINPFLFFILGIPVLLEFYMKKKKVLWVYDKQDNWIPIERKLDYIVNKTGHMDWAKDIRIYNMIRWINSLFSIEFCKRIRWIKKENKLSFLISIFSVLMSLVRDGVSYGYLIYYIYYKGMLASDFVFYYASMNQFSTNFMLFFESVNEYLFIHRQFCDLRDFLSIKDKSNRSIGENIGDDQQYEIEFVNVSYTFSGCKEPYLKNISFKINKGQKIAIIGKNGAGKTTLIKLMCGLYTPTEGHILINGKEVNKYNIYDLFNLFSPVFQDMYFLPASLEKNVTMQTEEQIDYFRLEQVAEQTGFSGVVNGMPNKWKTNLIKTVHNDAVNLSGGQQQRLALSRALYKNGKILILDEPTAALDPIIEKKIYMQYNDMSAGRTAVFISHRLASTSFCDSIFVLDNGKIVEKGDHITLLNKSEIYKEMFLAQSHYYKDEVVV